MNRLPFIYLMVWRRDQDRPTSWQGREQSYSFLSARVDAYRNEPGTHTTRVHYDSRAVSCNERHVLGTGQLDTGRAQKRYNQQYARTWPHLRLQRQFVLATKDGVITIVHDQQSLVGTGLQTGEVNPLTH